MRARLRVRHGLGFYREGSHELCDAAGTGQLRDASLQAAATILGRDRGTGATVSSIELAENIPADQRAILVELSAPGRFGRADVASLVGVDATSITRPLQMEAVRRGCDHDR